jgi:hypothetical protein
MCDASRAKRDVGASRKADDQFQIVQDNEAALVRIEVATGCDQARDTGWIANITVYGGDGLIGEVPGTCRPDGFLEGRSEKLPSVLVEAAYCTHGVCNKMISFGLISGKGS